MSLYDDPTMMPAGDDDMNATGGMDDMKEEGTEEGAEKEEGTEEEGTN